MQEILSRKKIGLRIRTLRIQNIISQESVAKILGLSRSNYSQVELGNQYPTYETLVKISILYKKSYEWILHGEKFAIKTSKNFNTKIQSPVSLDFPLAISGTQASKISLIDYVHHSDYIISNKSREFIDQLSTIEIPMTVHESGDNTLIFRAFEVIDDGMYHELQKEDIIIGKNIVKLSDLILNDMYVFITRDNMIIRRMVTYIEDNNLLVCKADNFNYPVSVIQLDDLQEVWHICGIFSTKFRNMVESMEHYLSKFENSISSLKKEFAEIKKKN